MKIFLLGGTKDSTNIIEFIKENYEAYILTTTTTEYGAKLARESGSDDTIARPLLKDEIAEIITADGYDILIDATHPFAEHITQTSATIAKELKMPYIRFERPTTNFENIDTECIHYVNSFVDAGKLIADEFKQGNVLHFDHPFCLIYVFSIVIRLSANSSAEYRTSSEVLASAPISRRSILFSATPPKYRASSSGRYSWFVK